MSKITRQVTPFKYAGTPEQVTKVGNWLERQGALRNDSIGDAPYNYLFVDPDYESECFTYQFCNSQVIYHQDENPRMPPEYELEIFGITQGITGKVENPWICAGDDMPVLPDGTLVDTIFDDGSSSCGDAVDALCWDGGIGPTYYRIHKPNEKYFVAPETPSKFKEETNVEDYQEIDKEESYTPVAHNKYMREIKPGVWVDVYDVIRAFSVTDGALQHLLKKALAAGARGHKDKHEDMKDILASAKRSLEIYEEWHVPKSLDFTKE